MQLHTVDIQRMSPTATLDSAVMCRAPFFGDLLAFTQSRIGRMCRKPLVSDWTFRAVSR
jgi:hypothetical protein